MANVLTPAGGIFRRWFVLEKAVARRIDDRTAKRMMRAAGWREDLMYALREEDDITATQTHHGARHTVHISIHALREEGDSKNGEKHLRFCFIIKRSAQIWKSFSKNIQKNSCDLHRTA